MRIISSLPPEVTKLLFDAGKRIIVLVEGDDDRYVLRERYLTDLNSAHQIIDGKRILHWVDNDHFRTGRDYLFRLLTDRAKLRGWPDDIARIVQDRILGSART